MFENANEQLLASLASQLQSGKTNPEEVAKLLNTVARFEERVNDTQSIHSQSVDWDSK